MITDASNPIWLHARFEEECDKAREESRQGHGVYVVAYLMPDRVTGVPKVSNFGISHWFDGSVVATFSNGVRKD